MRQCSTVSRFTKKILKGFGKLLCKGVLNIAYKIMCTLGTKCTMIYIYILWYGLLKFKYCDNGKSFGIKGTEGLLFQYYLGLSKLTGLRSVNQSHNQDEYNYLYCTTIALF